MYAGMRKGGSTVTLYPWSCWATQQASERLPVLLLAIKSYQVLWCAGARATADAKVALQ